MRLDLFIRNVTSFSRKEVKARILQRRVKVDGAIIKDCKYAVNENSLVLLDDMPVEAQASRYFMLYKPAGYISATKDANQPTALDLLDEPNKHQLHIAIGKRQKVVSLKEQIVRVTLAQSLERLQPFTE